MQSAGEDYLYFQAEGEERRINFRAGPLSQFFSVSQGTDEIEIYRKIKREDGSVSHISLANIQLPTELKSAIVILEPSGNGSSRYKDRIIDISDSKRESDSFLFINATGYQMIGQVNDERFNLDREIGSTKTVRFEPRVIRRDGRSDRVIVLSKMAIEKNGDWKKVDQFTQFFLNWKNGMSKAFVLYRNPNRDLQYDLDSRTVE